MEDQTYKPFLRWWLFFALIVLGILALFRYDMFRIVNAGDVTKLSFLIFCLFLFFTLYIGYYTYQSCKTSISVFQAQIETAWFIADIFLTLGMIGTVIGFIYMLSTAFKGVDPNDVVQLKTSLLVMSTGMSTALYTTASGLICGLLLKLQLFNLESSE
jgi:hypothetical protein